MVSHELRSPLNAIAAWVKLLQQAGGADPMVRRASETIERSVRLQAQIIGDLLDSSRLLSGNLPLERQRVDLAALLRGCIDDMRPSAAGSQVSLSLEIDPAAESLGVIGDHARLRQIATQLLLNALKFTDPGGTIRVSLSSSGEVAEICVDDTGAGIAPALLPHVFDRFRQGDSGPTRRRGGLGLGLSIVRQLAVLHGGTVVAASDGEGKGSRFQVSLPIAPEVRRPAEVTRPAMPRPLVSAAVRVDVLLVEDDPVAREALSLALRRRGARVRETASVPDALREFALRAPTVLVSDIAMPNEDGYALIRSIREREARSGSRAVAVAVTGFASREDREAAIAAGFDDHLAKPVDVDALFDRICSLSRTRDP